VVELKVLKSRLLRGQEEKARRGELFRLVAPGYRCDGDDRIVKDPDLRVQTAIQLVFTKFRESWSARQTHQWFIDNEVSLPRQSVWQGKGRHRMAVAGAEVHWIDLKEPDLRGRLRLRPEADQDGGERGTDCETGRPAIASRRMPRFHPRPS